MRDLQLKILYFWKKISAALTKPIICRIRETWKGAR